MTRQMTTQMRNENADEGMNRMTMTEDDPDDESSGEADDRDR